MISGKGWNSCYPMTAGALWVLRLVSGNARLALEPSVVFRSDALEPIATRQVVLFSSAREYVTRVAWQLAEVPAAPSHHVRAEAAGNHDRDHRPGPARR